MNPLKELPLVYVVILNWNGKGNLGYCLPSVLSTDYLNFRVVMVDNGSKDESVSFVKQKFPMVEVIRTQKNFGYAKGNNFGIRYALERKADYVVILNNDMQVDPKWLGEAVKAAVMTPRIGIVGFDVIGEWYQESEVKFREAQINFVTPILTSTNFITGCALFIRKEVFKKIGLFDEGFFLYSDEDDFELRLSRAGYEMVRINVPLWHKGEGSVVTDKIRIKSTYHTFKSYLRFYLKNYRFTQALKLIGSLFFRVYFKKNEKKTWYNYRRLRSSNCFLSLTMLIFAATATFFSIPQIRRARKSVVSLM